MPDTPYEEYLDEFYNFETGSQLQINCSDSYELIGESIITCQENGSWNKEPPKCILPQPEPEPTNVSCKIELVPQAPVNGYIVHESQVAFEDGTVKQIDYKCRSGYKLQGANNTTCTNKGVWTNPNNTCKRTIILILPKIVFYIKYNFSNRMSKSINTSFNANC